LSPTLSEGASLRPASARRAHIHVLNGVFEGLRCPDLLAHDLVPVINSLGAGRLLDGERGMARAYALHIDTGMNRLGLTPEQAVATFGQSDATPAPVPC
jgi:alanine racemase